MASTPEVALNSEKAGRGSAPAGFRGFPGADFGLRLLLFAASVSALVVLVTSKQTKAIPVLLQPQTPIIVTRTAKFSHSPAFIYLLVALSVTAFYSIISLIASASIISKRASSSKILFKLLVLDLLMAGIMASATGSSGSVAYIGLRGNDHVMWNKICNIFSKFCRHIASAAALSLVASIALILLVLLSSYTIYRRSI